MSVFIKGISLDEFADYDRDGIGYLIGTGQADEVPTPHGRLIDADELLRHKGDAYDSEGHLLYAVGTGSIIAAPTIIEAEKERDE